MLEAIYSGGVTVAIGPLNQGTVAMANALYQTLSGLDVKTARGSNGNTAYIGADFFALSHHGLHTITRLKAMNPLFSG